MATFALNALPRFKTAAQRIASPATRISNPASLSQWVAPKMGAGTAWEIHFAAVIEAKITIQSRT
jgi:hypothetical protein